MAFTVIDRVTTPEGQVFEIRKLHSPDRSKVFGYLSGLRCENGNLKEVEEHISLKDARKRAGWAGRPTTETLPKSAYAQNRKGYRASGTKKG